MKPDIADYDMNDPEDAAWYRQQLSEWDATQVRGKHYADWADAINPPWPKNPAQEPERLSLLLDIVAAIEAEQKLTGRAMPDGYTTAAAEIYLEAGDQPAAIAILRRYITHDQNHQLHEPDGGDNARKRVTKFLAQLTA